MNYIQDKVPAHFSITTQSLDEYAENDDQPMNYALCYDEQNLEEEKKECRSKNELLCMEEAIEEEKIEITKPKGSNGKESRNKKEMFVSSRSFKEIFNFFKDRDKKRSHESSKSGSSEGSKVLKTSESYDQKFDRSSQSTQSSTEQNEKELELKSDSQGPQQTPLIFSRRSSLGSLAGQDQNFVNDDRSSIVSDFSHKTSGRVSPNELPDSPVQFTPSSAKLQQKCQIGCFGKKKIATVQQDQSKIHQQSVVSNDIPYQQSENNPRLNPFSKSSVFEDYVTSFKDESTPTKLHSVAASSLSSLTIDDDDDFELVKKSILNNEKQSLNEEVHKVQSDRQEPIGESNNEDGLTVGLEEAESVHLQQENYSREEDDQLMNLTHYEEELLDECIRRGIAKLTKQNINEIRPFSWDLGLTCLATKALLASRIRLHSVEILSKIIEEQSSQDNNTILINNKNNSDKSFLKDVSQETHSSLNSDVIKQDKSNNQMTNSSYSTYEEQLLDQCIRRGIAKITKKNINDIRPFSWDTNQICLTTMLHGYNDEVNSGICAT
ncbi:adenomatous polyposis coli homolog [Copidosoma floridanum]|uniref:adenomatous polyposis coli homolog n=1 Tax=Copidosoma floridanum TaxID=29053 RepID=UPI0006C9A039|nr:adenomatous polyposis coli homolog [Copidosoma floridanum]